MGNFLNPKPTNLIQVTFWSILFGTNRIELRSDVWYEFRTVLDPNLIKPYALKKTLGPKRQLSA